MVIFRKSEVGRNIAALALVQFANYIAPFLVLPYLSRTLGLEGFGTVAMSISLCSIALIITDYGFGFSAPYWLAKNKDNKNDVASYIGAIFIIKAILFLACIGVILLFFKYSTIIPNESVIHLAILASILFQTFQPNWFFLGIEKMKSVTIFMVIAKISYVVLVFLLVKKQSQVEIVLACFAFSNLLATSIGIYYIYKENFWIAKPPIKTIKIVVIEGAFFFVSRLAVGIYTSASTFLVGAFTGVGSAALYNSAEKLYQAGQSATSPVSQALYPYLARTGDKQALYKFVGILLVPLSICVLLGVYYAELVMALIFGDEFRAASELLQIFLLILLVNFVGVNFGYPAFASIGRVDIANKSVIYAAFLQLIVITLLYYLQVISAKSICLGVLAVEFVVMVIRLYLYFLLEKIQVCENKKLE